MRKKIDLIDSREIKRIKNEGTYVLTYLINFAPVAYSAAIMNFVNIAVQTGLKVDRFKVLNVYGEAFATDALGGRTYDVTDKLSVYVTPTIITDENIAGGLPSAFKISQPDVRGFIVQLNGNRQFEVFAALAGSGIFNPSPTGNVGLSARITFVVELG
jgi:hypothetical protein